MLAKTDFITEARDLSGRDVYPSIFSDSFGGLKEPKAGKPEDIVVTLDCCLEEFYNGSIKQVDYQQAVVQHDAKSIKFERKVQQVEVKPGFNESTELVFKKLGHQAAGHIAANLIVKFKQMEHQSFRRSGHNLILKHKISLLDTFERTPVTFKTLDARTITLGIDE